MKPILDTILETKSREIAELKRRFNYKDFEQTDLFNSKVKSLSSSIVESEFGIIAEIKRKSPSAGTIKENIDVVQTGQLYQSNGAAGISCLTDREYFGGSDNDLKLLKANTNIPILRKEFIIDEIQIFESKAIGADTILLIAETLDYHKALHFTIIAQSLGMEVLMELHHASEIKKLNDQVNIIGINNRDLRIQKTDINTSFNLFPYLPQENPIISESGIKTIEEIDRLKNVGFSGALIGESILKQDNPISFFESLKFKTC